MSPDPAALDEGRKQARIQGYAWDRRAYESFAAGWALGVAEGRRQRDEDLQYGSDQALIGAIGLCPVCGGSPGEHPKGFDSCPPPDPAKGPKGILAALDPACHCDPLVWAGSDAVDVIADTVREARGE